MLLKVVVPESFKFPVISRASAGEVVPIPTLPSTWARGVLLKIPVGAVVDPVAEVAVKASAVYPVDSILT